MLMVTGEGYCSAPIDDVGSIDGVGGVATVGSIDAINATMPSIANIDKVDDIHVTGMPKPMGNHKNTVASDIPLPGVPLNEVAAVVKYVMITILYTP